MERCVRESVGRREDVEGCGEELIWCRRSDGL